MMHKYKRNFLNKEDENFFYILGAFITDGSIYINDKLGAYRAYLYSNDKSWLKKINKYFSNTNCIYKNRKCFALTISCKKIVQKFIEKGVVPNKSLIVNFPEVPDKYLPDFIRGCIDGDGTIGIFSNNKYKTPECKLCSSSLNFITEYKKKLDNQNISSCMIKIPQHKAKIFNKISNIKDHFIVKIHRKNDTKNFIKWVYYDGHTLSLKRKFKKGIEILNSPDKIDLSSDQNPLKKLNTTQVIEILEKYKNGFTQKKLGLEYGVSRSCIQGIVNGRRWKKITQK